MENLRGLSVRNNLLNPDLAKTERVSQRSSTIAISHRAAGLRSKKGNVLDHGMGLMGMDYNENIAGSST